MIPYSDRDNPNRSFPIVNVALILANFAVFGYELYEGSIGRLDHFYLAYSEIPCELFRRCSPVPGSPQPIYTTIFTAMFMHAGWLHILGNMLFLWVFGDNVESSMGHVRYLIFYLLCGLAAGLAQALVSVNSTVPNLGASGAIAGVLAAYLVLFPTASIRTILLIFIIPLPIRLYAWILIGVWFVEQLFSGVASLGPNSQQGGVAFIAHVGGFVCGLVLVRLFSKRDRVDALRHYQRQWTRGEPPPLRRY